VGWNCTNLSGGDLRSQILHRDQIRTSYLTARFRTSTKTRIHHHIGYENVTIIGQWYHIRAVPGTDIFKWIVCVVLLKTGCALGLWWTDSIFQSPSAAWQDYKALLLHFNEAECDCNRDVKYRRMDEVLQREIQSAGIYFGFTIDVWRIFPNWVRTCNNVRWNYTEPITRLKILLKYFKEERRKERRKCFNCERFITADS
jgi:hypothetical protein